MPGTDGAGVVVAVGSRVRRFRRGDRVYAYSFDNSKGGFYAEYAAVPAQKTGRVPRRLDLFHAGGGATTALTALHGVDDALKIRKGEAIIIHGASGGVGTLAVQFAKRRGARIFATASGKDGVALTRRLGAEAAWMGTR
ncbi:MAG: alcohol dehydrogenase catalytic domain-containing protein [Thermoanaerobaculia bacterium]